MKKFHLQYQNGFTIQRSTEIERSVVVSQLSHTLTQQLTRMPLVLRRLHCFAVLLKSSCRLSQMLLCQNKICLLQLCGQRQCKEDLQIAPPAHQRSVMSIQENEKNRIILIISYIYTHSYLSSSSTLTQSLTCTHHIHTERQV